MTAFCFNVRFTQHPNFAGIRLLVPSRVGTLFLPYTAALEGERKNNCMSKSNLKWSCTVSESTLLVRDVDIYLRKSNLEAFTFFWVEFADTYCQGQCFCDQFSNCAQRERGSSFGLWAEEGSEWKPGSAHGYLSASCPETQYWSVIACDTTRPHTFPYSRIRTLDRQGAHNLLSKTIFFTRSTGAGSVLTSWAKPHEPQMEQMCFPSFYHITVACFLPLRRFTHLGLSSPSWLPVPHYRRDNHHVHDTQETQPPHKLFTHRSQTFIILPAVTPINLYRLVIIWPFQLTVFPGFPTLP